jgi:hypothetical protein
VGKKERLVPKMGQKCSITVLHFKEPLRRFCLRPFNKKDAERKQLKEAWQDENTGPKAPCFQALSMGRPHTPLSILF